MEVSRTSNHETKQIVPSVGDSEYIKFLGHLVGE